LVTFVTKHVSNTLIPLIRIIKQKYVLFSNLFMILDPLLTWHCSLLVEFKTRIIEEL